MRTIKFRGKRIKGGDWIYGSLVKELYNYYIVELIDQTKEAYTHISVEKETVGQFTGLHDKNGKEIYEGDIVKDEFGRIMKIEYWNYRLCFVAISTTNFHHADFFDWAYIDISTDLLKTETEIIGNIYENPELLEKKFSD